jgi:hypothetical protein
MDDGRWTMGDRIVHRQAAKERQGFYWFVFRPGKSKESA